MENKENKSNIILSVKDFTLSFISDDNVNVVSENISFKLKKGKTLGIVGESGSGKTVTTLSLIKLLDYPPAKIQSGQAWFYNKGEKVNLLDLSENNIIDYRGKRISCIFQTPMTSLNPSIKCGKQVEEMILKHLHTSKKEAYNETIRLFQEVKLPRPEYIYKSYPFQISGGQRQRIMIAMAIACKPDILIADEPTTALDVVVQKSIIELLKDIQQRYGTTIIFISHNLGIIKEIADDVIVMRKGKIVEEGSVEQIFNNPNHPYTMGLIACKPNMYNNLKYLPTVQEIEKNKEVNPDFSVKEYIDSLKIDKSQVGLSDIIKEPHVLSINNLSVYFPKDKKIFTKKQSYIKAVDNVTLQIPEGKTMGLLGESGCGKSTLAKVITGLQKPTDGMIFFKDENITSVSRNKRIPVAKKIQMIFQDPYSSLNPRMTVGQALIEPLKVHNIISNKRQQNERIFYLLNKVGLNKSDYYKYPHEFSGGQRQRICIARALTMNPELLICDEPVSSLDVSVQAIVLNLLYELKKEFNLSMLLISHDIAVVRHISDVTAVMKEGTIIELNTPDKLIDSPQKEYTYNLINSSL